MEKLVFTDGDRFGVFDGEKTELFDSEYVMRYRENAERVTKNDEWKYGGEGARFRGDYQVYQARRQQPVVAYINGVEFDGEKVVYAFTADMSSGVYRKDVRDKKAREEHVFTSANEEIVTLCKGGRRYAVTVKREEATSSIALLDPDTSELKTLTDGDSRDENPVFTNDGTRLLFDSSGVGRDAKGNFTGVYSPAAILSLDLNTMEIEEVVRDKKYAYVKPKIAQNGDLYCIKRPNGEKKSGNIFLDILLFPFRIIKAIFGFLQAFVMIFGQTSLTSSTAEGSRGRETDRNKLYVDGALIEADKELKRNAKKKGKEYGFIPQSWKLVKRSGEKEEIVKSGVCDLALCRDGGAYCTDGKHIYYLKEGLVRKIADTESCLHLSVERSQEFSETLFGF